MPLAAVGAVTVCLLASCAALGPAGRGGWSAERRSEELDRARAAATRTAPARLVETNGTAAPAAYEQPSRLDLATALELASRNNRTIAVADTAVEAAAGTVGVARAALLPAASVRGSYSWFSDEQANSVDPDGDPSTPPIFITIREKEFVSINAAARLALDLSGELRHGLGAAQASYRAERARAWATRLEQERTVADAYFGLLEAERLHEVGLQTVALYDRQRSDSASRFEQGRLTRNGVLVIEVALIDARQSVLRLDNAIAAARRNLNVATGLDVAAPTIVTDVAGPPDLPALDEAVASIRTHNPLVSAMLEEVAAADARVTSAKRARLPRFSATAGYDATSQDTLQPNNYASAGVGMELDLYSFAREGDIARLEAGATRSRLLLDRTVRDVEMLVRGTHDRLRERLLAIDAAAVAVGQAEENRRIRQVQFDEGRATSEDLLDASQLLTRQRAALASAIYQAHLHRAELQQLIGRPLAALSEVADRRPATPANGDTR